MTSQEAISVLGGDENQVEEFVTQEVFELKTNLLKGTLVPQVMEKKAEKLEHMAHALVVLGFEDEQTEEIDLTLKPTTAVVSELLVFFRDYEQKQSQLKLRLMQSFHPKVVAQLLRQMAVLEGKKFVMLKDVFLNTAAEVNVKLSEYIDSGVIISELKSVSTEQHVGEHLASFPTLKKEIDKSFKYCKFVEAKKRR